VREAQNRGPVRLSHMVAGGGVFGEDGLGLGSESQIYWVHSSLGNDPTTSIEKSPTGALETSIIRDLKRLTTDGRV